MQSPNQKPDKPWWVKVIEWLNPMPYFEYRGYNEKHKKIDVEGGFKFKPKILWNKEKDDGST